MAAAFRLMEGRIGRDDALRQIGELKRGVQGRRAYVRVRADGCAVGGLRRRVSSRILAAGMREGVANIAFARSHSEGASERFSSQVWKLASVMAGIIRRVRPV